MCKGTGTSERHSSYTQDWAGVAHRGFLDFPQPRLRGHLAASPSAVLWRGMSHRWGSGDRFSPGSLSALHLTHQMSLKPTKSSGEMYKECWCVWWACKIDAALTKVSKTTDTCGWERGVGEHLPQGTPFQQHPPSASLSSLLRMRCFPKIK